MAEVNTFNQVLFVNGEPILVKDVSLNQIDTFCSDVLNQQCQLINPQLIDSCTHSDVLSTELDTSDNACTGISLLDRPSVGSGLDGCSEQNELITVLSSDSNLEGTTAISLTIEQAAQLGLHFNVNTIVDTNLENNSSAPTINNISFIGSSGTEEKHVGNTDEYPFIDPSNKSSEKGHQINALELGSQNNSDSDALEKSIFLNPIAYSSENSPLNQQLTLVPQIVNGVLTYTLQLSNEAHQINEVNNANEELYTISEDPTVTNDSEPVGVVLDSNNVSPADLPFTNPTDRISAISNETPGTVISKPNINVSRCNSTDTDEQIEGLGLVSCDTQNLAYLNISEAIPCTTNSIITRTVDTHINRLSSITQQSHLVTPVTQSNSSGSASTILKHFSVATKRKIFSNQGESLLLKHRNNLPQKGVNVKPSTGYTRSTENMKNNKFDTYIIKQLEIGGKTHAFISETGPNTNKEIDESQENSCKDTASLSLPVTSQSVDESSESSADPVVTATIITPTLGDLPEEVSVVLSRIPIKTNIKKPLGSGENPIKLVQRGTTFHSIQALTEDHISKIKPILQEKFDSKTPNKNVIYDPASNTRIIYRIISPSDLNLRRNGESPKKRGRPRKLRLEPGIAEETTVTAEPPPTKKVFSRTRSGRLSRPPKHMVRDFKHLKRPGLDGSDGASSDYQSENEVEPSEPPSSVAVDLLPGLVARRTLKRNISKANVCPTCNKVYLGYDRMKRHFNNFPDHGSIEFLNTVRNSNPDSEAECNRVNGGNGLSSKRRKRRGRFAYFTSSEKRTRLQQALSWCGRSDLAEVAGPAVASALSLWELLLLRVDAVRDKSRVATLYHELRLLLAKLRKMTDRLFRPLDHELTPSAKHVTVEVEEDMSNLLNLPCGVYLASDEDLNDPVIQSTQTPDQEPQVAQTAPVCERDSREDVVDDPKAKTHIDEVPQQYLLSEEMIMDADERGLINVDDIVSERLHNFTGSQNSSVDEIMKGLNELDQRDKMETDDLMEEFAIVARRTHVSASTEDLMKSLEHFESDLSHPDPNISLDRDAFDQNVTSVEALDFEVLSREFHSNNT